MNGPGASNRSLYRMELRRSSASYPEGNFGGNQLLDGSIGLSPLHPVPTIDLHVRGASDFHQSFLWLHPDRAWIAIFRVPGRSLRQSRPSRTRKRGTDPGVMRPRAAPKLDDKIGLVQAAGSHRWAEGGWKLAPDNSLGKENRRSPLGEEGKQPHASHEPSLSSRRGKVQARGSDGGRPDAAPAGSGTARRRVRREKTDGTRPTAPPDDTRTTSPRHLSRSTPSYTLSRFRYAFGVSQRGPLRLANGQDSSVRVSRRVGWVADARR